MSKLQTIFKYLRPAVFNYKQGTGKALPTGKTFGIMAQDLEMGFKAAGLDWQDYTILQKDSEGYFQVDYGQLIPLLIVEIKELKERVQELEENVSTKD